MTFFFKSHAMSHGSGSAIETDAGRARIERATQRATATLESSNPGRYQLTNMRAHGLQRSQNVPELHIFPGIIAVRIGIAKLRLPALAADVIEELSEVHDRTGHLITELSRVSLCGLEVGCATALELPVSFPPSCCCSRLRAVYTAGMWST